MGYSEDMAAFTQYRSGAGDIADLELAMLIYRMVVGGGGGSTLSSVTLKDGDTTNLLDIDAAGRIGINNFPATQPISGSISVSNFPATQPLPALNNSRLPVYRQDRAQQQVFTITAGATQSDWFAINSDSKLVLLETPAMTGTSLQVRWRHPTGSGTGNPIVDTFGNVFSLTIGSTARTFSSDALAPLARCFLGDGEISFVSNLAEGATRTLKLYY